jgi:hypothetical protein
MPMTNHLPYGGAYENFPADPQTYQNGAAEPALKSLFSAAVLHAQDRIGWYAQKASQQARIAKRIRFVSLVLFAFGTLAPILATVVGKIFKGKDFESLANFPWAEVGYVLLAVAGALVVFDQFFDTSGSWIRARRTEARLQVMLADFRFAWSELLTKYGGIPTEQPQRAELAAAVRGFVTKVELVAETETGEWAQRFSQRIESFDNNPNLRMSFGRDDKGRDGRTSHGTHAGEFDSDAASEADGGRPRQSRASSGRGEKRRAARAKAQPDPHADATGGPPGQGGIDVNRGEPPQSVDGAKAPPM